MTQIYKSEYIIISLNKNILYHTILNKLPNIEEFVKMSNVLQTFYNICIEKNKHFYQIYNFNNIELSSIPEFSKCTNFIKDFFIKNKDIFNNNLYCSGIIINNFLVRNALKLVLNVYLPAKPFTFVKNESEVYTFFKNIREEYKQKKWILGYDETQSMKTIDELYYNKDNDNIKEIIKKKDVKKILKDKDVNMNEIYEEELSSETEDSNEDNESEKYEIEKTDSVEYINKKKEIEEIIDNNNIDNNNIDNIDTVD